MLLDLVKHIVVFFVKLLRLLRVKTGCYLLGLIFCCTGEEEPEEEESLLNFFRSYSLNFCRYEQRLSRVKVGEGDLSLDLSSTWASHPNSTSPSSAYYNNLPHIYTSLVKHI